jgi:hypothetical protein
VPLATKFTYKKDWLKNKPHSINCIKSNIIEYHCEGEGGEGGRCGASISELKAEGESAASAHSTEVGFWSHREGSPSSRTRVPIIELTRMSSSFFILVRTQKDNLLT